MIIEINNARHVIWECRTCGCVSTCPEIIWDQQRAEGGFHSCPNGHQWGWSKENCERETLRRERDRLKQRLAEEEGEAAHQRNLRQATERQLSATKGVITRIKNRIGHGVCPCCNRTFSDLQRHMHSKHPTYPKADVLEAAE